jgi:signal transduction histidine kinase
VNLVVNAADAIQGRPDARIALRTAHSDSHAVIEVEDNGPGVPPDQREKIFEPFVSTKGSSGNGLGLWISAEIARRHGGSLTVHPASGGGAIFRLALPLRIHRPESSKSQQMARAHAAVTH